MSSVYSWKKFVSMIVHRGTQSPNSMKTFSGPLVQLSKEKKKLLENMFLGPVPKLSKKYKTKAKPMFVYKHQQI